MKIKLVVCCDGTSNSEFLGEEKSPLTNVSLISRAIPQFGSDCRQIVLYLPGIGTDEGNLFNSINQGLGVGLNSQIKEAYAFLCHNYNEKTNDDIILIGFSRGAFAVRCIMDFVLRKGLLKKEQLHYLPTFFQEWMNQLENTPSIPDVRYPRIHVCALWDSVNSVGFPRSWPLGRGKPTVGFVNSDLPDGVENAFQALSLFERRFHFHPIVLRKPEGSNCNLHQCWFPGYHGDIGGGNDKEALAHFALAWMIAKLQGFLAINETTFGYRRNNQPTWVLPDDLKIHDPYSSWWGWRSAGSSHRTPRLDFWNADGIYHEDAAQLVRNRHDPDDFSREKIHPSARFMRQWGYLMNHFNTCQSLSRKSPRQIQGAWVWVLNVSQNVIQHWQNMKHPISGGPADTPYNLWEDDLDEREQAMLANWALDEHELLLENSEPGDPNPDTIIVQFAAWIVNHYRA